VDGRSVLEDKNIDAIFDTGVLSIIGDSRRVKQFYAALEPFGAKSAFELGDGIYTGTWSSWWFCRPAAVQCLIFLSQSLATLVLPSRFMLEARKSRFPLKYLKSLPYLKALILV